MICHYQAFRPTPQSDLSQSRNTVTQSPQSGLSNSDPTSDHNYSDPTERSITVNVSTKNSGKTQKTQLLTEDNFGSSFAKYPRVSLLQRHSNSTSSLNKSPFNSLDIRSSRNRARVTIIHSAYPCCIMGVYQVFKKLFFLCT